MNEANNTIQGVSALPTPTLLLNGPKIRNNIQRLTAYASTVGLNVRPHTKTHKQKYLSTMQIAAGATGITVAKVGEAEAISDTKQDVLIAYPPVGMWRAEQIAELARSRTVRVALDSVTAIEMISEAASTNNSTVGVLVDIDVGMGRTGVQTPEESLAIAKSIDSAPNLRLDGIMVYPGHIWAVPSEQGTSMKAVSAKLQEALDLWRRHGLTAAIVSGGSTPTAFQSHLIPELTEIRPGAYIFNDMNTVAGGFCTLDDCAALIIATVVSVAVPTQIVIDAGSKTLTKDTNIPRPESGYGHIIELPSAQIRNLSEEHAQVDVTQCDVRPRIGDRLTIIPNHICACVNLQDSIWWNEPGEPLKMLPVDARGKSQ